VDRRWTYDADSSIEFSYGITLLSNNTKTELFRFKSDNTTLDFNPFSFSNDGKYFAYVKNIQQPGPYVWWISYLYTIELNTKQVTFIDTGNQPKWNPALTH